MYAVQTKGLTKKYSTNIAVNNVDMHVPLGAVYGFVGENGSGKTTIMRLLMGLANPTGGDYSLFEVESKDPKIYSIRHNISAIIEAPSLVPSMTAEENLTYACLYYGVNGKVDIKKVLKDVGLENTGKKKVKNFSLGMRQRLGIAVLLLNDPKLMLLDEPMNGLDPSGIKELRDLIMSLNQKGITFVISSHILSELEKVATHYGFISKGRLLKEISTRELEKECEKAIVIRYHDIEALSNALKAASINDYQIDGQYFKIREKLTPLALLTKLKEQGIEIEDIATKEENIEEYYLNLIHGGKR